MAKGLSSELLVGDAPQTAQQQAFEKLNLDGGDISNKTLTLCHFREIGFKQAKLENCVFNHSRFERCYFRKAIIANVSFIGCTFQDCRFDEAQLTNCHLDYSEFYNSHVTYRQLAHTFPSADNVVRLLARNLRVNAQNRGQTEDYRAFLLREIQATERHNYRKAFDRSDSFYRNKYSTWDRLLGLGTWLAMKLNWHFWGHGEAPHRVLLSAAAVIFLFAVFFSRRPNDFRVVGTQPSFSDFLGLSLAAFTTLVYGEFLPITSLARWLITVEGAIGVTVFGFFVAALYRRISRR